MTVRMPDLVCPACRSALERAAVELRCTSCGLRYPVVLGIPDLRLWPDPYIGFDEDRQKAARLDEHCRDLDFLASVEAYYALTTAVPPFQARRFARSLAAATARSEFLLAGLMPPGGSRRGALLDVGCGTAPLLVAASRTHDSAVGVDIAMRWLVLARKRLADAGVSAPLVCACAEALPFPDDSFDDVVAESMVEHLRDQRAGTREMARVLTAGGSILVTTPNRHSLGPDPHTGLPVGSWLPDSLSAAYVRRKGGIPPRRKLLVARELEGLLAAAGFTDIQVGTPDISPAQSAVFGRLTRVASAAYRIARRNPIGRVVARALGPLLHAAGRKPRPA